MKILIASGNEGKIKEIKEIFSNFEIVTLNDINEKIEVLEDQETFEGNAKKKAKEIYEKTLIPCIADDSGLCIKEYDGWPGVKTARFLGEEKAGIKYAKQRNEYILKKMEGLKKEERRAEVVAVIAFYDGKEFKIGTGVISGYIAEEPKGENGFGFDEIFELEDGRTLAELDSAEKNAISSRRKALEEIVTIFDKNNQKVLTY
jgi:XTP/dITP diphosphohydrolase